MLPKRKKLSHEIPSWVPDDAMYFISINTQPRYENQLCKQEVAATIWDSMRFRIDRGEWFVHLILLMPDHLHAIMSFPKGASMRKSVGQWKRYIANRLAIKWQRDFFERRLRSDENLLEKASYIRMNPVRRGLCAKPEDWPYVWSAIPW